MSERDQENGGKRRTILASEIGIVRSGFPPGPFSIIALRSFTTLNQETALNPDRDQPVVQSSDPRYGANPLCMRVRGAVVESVQIDYIREAPTAFVYDRPR